MIDGVMRGDFGYSLPKRQVVFRGVVYEDISWRYMDIIEIVYAAGDDGVSVDDIAGTLGGRGILIKKVTVRSCLSSIKDRIGSIFREREIFERSRIRKVWSLDIDWFAPETTYVAQYEGKRCAFCMVVKPFGDFPDDGGKPGFGRYCRKCNSKRMLGVRNAALYPTRAEEDEVIASAVMPDKVSSGYQWKYEPLKAVSRYFDDALGMWAYVLA